jgi:hypothetical protein
MRSLRTLIIGSLSIAICIACYAQQQGNVDDNQAMLTQLKQDRVKTAKDCFDAMLAAYNAGTVTLDLVLTTGEKLRDAELAIAKNDKEGLKSLRTHLERIKPIRDKIQALQRMGARGGEAEKALFSELAYQDAEIAVLSAMAAPAEPK